MRRLYLGGSFNPIHHGHLICAQAAAEIAHFDRVVLIPSAQPPHKPGEMDMAPADDRVAMCRLATKNSNLFEVDDLETHRHGLSYTLETARELRRRGVEQVCWLIGADTLPQLPTWHNPAALLQEVTFVTMARPGWRLDWTTLEPEYHALRQNVVTTPLIEISATDIRRRIQDGRPVDYLTPATVIAYIRERQLYTSHSLGL